MRPAFLALAAGLAASAAASGQSLRVLSEFRRVGADGNIVDPDMPGIPREILSPSILRGGYATFHLVVTAPPGKRYTLYIGENPDKMLNVTLYRAEFTDAGGQLVPDRLVKVTQPATGMLGKAGSLVEPAAAVFVLDLWAPPTTPSRRVRIEAQLNVGDRWIIYPLEVRVQYAQVRDLVAAKGVEGRLSEPSSDAARGPMIGYLCAAAEKATSDDLTVRHLIRRNAAADVALARQLEIKHGEERVRLGLVRAWGGESVKEWCAAKPAFVPDPEKYLRGRDFLQRLALE